MADTILALDLATTSGWAIGRVGETPRYGSIRFAPRGHSMAAAFRGCREWLDAFIAVEHPAVVIFEGPLAPSFVEGRTSTDVVRSLMGLIAIVEETLYDRGIRVREAQVSTVRGFFLGTNRIKRDDAKLATKRRCQELGLFPSDDNAADAIALWLYMCSVIDPAIAVRLTPLFGSRR